MTRSTSEESEVRPYCQPAVAVAAENPKFEDDAQRLAKRLSLPRYSVSEINRGYVAFLVIGREGLSLTPADRSLGGAVRIDFLRGPTAQRRKQSGPGGSLLARALGIRGNPSQVIDATAGLGRDALQLASLGCKVTALERSPILFELLSDALERARKSTDRKLKAVIERIQLCCADGRTFLSNLTAELRPEIVYLDPMYIPREASALSKKEMRLLRLIVGDDYDAVDLLRIARSAAQRRVVVKRHRHAAPLMEGPVHAHLGKSVRYDVYLPTTE